MNELAGPQVFCVALITFFALGVVAYGMLVIPWLERREMYLKSEESER